MMIRNLCLATLVLASAAAFAGCNSNANTDAAKPAGADASKPAATDAGKPASKGVDADIEAAMAEIDSVIKEIVAAIDASPNSKGMDAAQKAFDDRKAALKAKIDPLKAVPDSQVSPEMQEKFGGSLKTGMDSIQAVVDKHSKAISSDPGNAKKLEKLLDDFAKLFME